MKFSINDRVLLLQDRTFANESVSKGTKGTVSGIDPVGPYYLVQFDGATLPHIVPEKILAPTS